MGTERSILLTITTVFLWLGCITPNIVPVQALRILLTNNDGIEDVGLTVLKQALRAAEHDVWVYAPSEAQMGPALALTLPFVNITQVADQEFAVDGFPATCVLLGLTELLSSDGVVDLVISGPSSGFTSGGQDLHSGTLGGALTGISKGFTSLAVLTDAPDDEREEYFGQVSQFIVNMIGTLENLFPEFPYGVGLKIGYPQLPPNEILGVTLASNNFYFPVSFGYEPSTTQEGMLQANMIAPAADSSVVNDPSNDQNLLNSGFITALAIQADISVKTTHYNGFFLGGLSLLLESMSVN